MTLYVHSVYFMKKCMVFTHKVLEKRQLEIVPLSSSFVSRASCLVDTTFRHHKTKRHSPSDRIKSCLRNKEWKSDGKEYVNLKYFVLKPIDSLKVMGFIGFYRNKKDNPFKMWIDWLVVDPEARGKGLGSVLVDFAISYAKNHGFTLLSLYTTNHPSESKAQELYAQKGFIVKEVKPSVFWTGFVKEKRIA